MNEIFNRTSTKEKRRGLRKNQTDAEKMLWNKIRNRQLHGHKIFRQYSISNYIADFYCPKEKLVIEVDGGQHFSDEHQSRDEARSDFMKKLGIKTIRVANNEVLKNIDGVLKAIENELPLTPSFAKRGKQGLRNISY